MTAYMLSALYAMHMLCTICYRTTHESHRLSVTRVD